jgi:hypothetical protein
MSLLALPQAKGFCSSRCVMLLAGLLPNSERETLRRFAVINCGFAQSGHTDSNNILPHKLTALCCAALCRAGNQIALLLPAAVGALLRVWCCHTCLPQREVGHVGILQMLCYAVQVVGSCAQQSHRHQPAADTQTGLRTLTMQGHAADNTRCWVSKAPADRTCATCGSGQRQRTGKHLLHVLQMSYLLERTLTSQTSRLAENPTWASLLLSSSNFCTTCRRSYSDVMCWKQLKYCSTNRHTQLG